MLFVKVVYSVVAIFTPTLRISPDVESVNKAVQTDGIAIVFAAKENIGVV
jgi:hypothetical protein